MELRLIRPRRDTARRRFLPARKRGKAATRALMTAPMRPKCVIDSKTVAPAATLDASGRPQGII